MSMEHLLTEAVIDEIARRVSEKLTHQWSIVVTELANTREANEKVTQQLARMKEQFAQQLQASDSVVQQATQELQHVRENQAKAAILLDKAIKDLGLGE